MGWKVLRTVTSPRLEELVLNFYHHGRRNEPIVELEEFDDLLCEIYDGSHESCTSRFHVSLNLMNPESFSKDSYRGVVEQVREAWPNFLQKGTVKLSFKPWILGERYQDM